MKRMRSASLGLVATLGLLGVMSASASAAPPEFGRCVPAATPKTGEYAGARCTKPAAGKGSYNFVPGPGAKPKFEGSSAEGVTLEAPNLTITCAASTFNGEYTGPKTASVTVDLIGCIDAASLKRCQSNPAKEGEIEPPGPLEGEIGFINVNGHKQVGLDLKRSPAITAFTCNNVGELPEVSGTLEGSVIAQIAPTNAMRSEFKLRYRSAGGKQVPESFEGGAKDTLTEKLLSGLTTTTEEAALKIKLVEVLNEEPLEIKAK